VRQKCLTKLYELFGCAFSMSFPANRTFAFKLTRQFDLPPATVVELLAKAFAGFVSWAAAG
jgi:hypothetical protein